MRNTFYTFFLILFGFGLLQAQGIQYGFDVENSGQVTALATPDFDSPDGQLTTALFAFTLPAGTMTAPGIMPGGTSNFTNKLGEWTVQRLTAAEYAAAGGAMGSLDEQDVYVATFSSNPGLPVAYVSGDSLPLFCFQITNGCDGGGIISVLSDASLITDLNGVFGANFTNQFSVLMPDPMDPTCCVMPATVTPDAARSMPDCPPPLIPTMSQWALFLFGLVVFTLGVVVMYNVKMAVNSEQ